MRVKKDQDLKLAEILRRIKAQGTTLSSIAKKASIAQSTIASWSAGAVPNDMAALRRLARVLKMSLEQLLFGEEPPIDASSLSLEQFVDDLSKSEIFSGKFEVDLRIKRITPQKKSGKDEV